MKTPLCKCGCGKPVKWSNLYKRWNTFLIGHFWNGKKRSVKWKPLENNAPLCKCGCGKLVMRSKILPYNWNIYLDGHSRKGKKLPPISTEHRKNLCKSQKKRYKDPKEHEKMSRIMKRVCKNPAGENSPNWRGGISFKPYPLEFRQIRESIRERDNHICQLCSKDKQEKSGRKLSIHHIDYDRTNNNPKNLITLCIPCNIKVNNNKKFWTRIFRDMIKEIYKKNVA